MHITHQTCRCRDRAWVLSPLHSTRAVLLHAAFSSVHQHERLIPIAPQVYGTARGVACTGEQRAMIEEYVAALEGRNPNARPTDSMDKLEGSWKLV